MRRKIESKTDTDGDRLEDWQLIRDKEKYIHDALHAEKSRGKQNNHRNTRKNKMQKFKNIQEWVLYLVKGWFGQYIPQEQ